MSPTPQTKDFHESTRSPKEQPPVGTSQRVSNLDQWRGWALIFVLVNHGFKWTGAVEGLGRAGVNIFFVISGILTALSLDSLRKRNQNIFLELPRKRAWRLVPTLLVFVLLAAGIQGLQGIESWRPNLLYPFYANYAPYKFGLGHLWSIACEMHFYLISPVLFWIGTRGKTGALAFWGLFLIFCGLAAAHVLHTFDPNPSPLAKSLLWNKYHTHVAVWPMLLGFGWFLHRFRFPEWAAVHVRKYITALMFIAHAVLIGVLWFGSPALTVLPSLGLIPLLLFTFQENRALDGKLGVALVWIGQRTFSIYLIQQMLTLNPSTPDAWRPLGALLAIPIGAIFYVFVESRFITRPPRSTV